MSNNRMVRYEYDPANPPPLTEAQLEEIERLKALGDEGIDYSDIPAVTDFSNFVRLRDVPTARKQSTTVRIDADVLDWLKSKGKGYQTRINAILRSAMMKDVA